MQLLYISYSQICVHIPCLLDPFNLWTETHVSQGFCWREGSVSFRTLDPDGYIKVETVVVPKYNLRLDTVRGIRVPFAVPRDGKIEVATVTDSFKITAPQGNCDLVFETGLGEERTMWCTLAFINASSRGAVILRCDQDLSPPEPLVMVAGPASAYGP